MINPGILPQQLPLPRLIRPHPPDLVPILLRLKHRYQIDASPQFLAGEFAVARAHTGSMNQPLLLLRYLVEKKESKKERKEGKKEVGISLSFSYLESIFISSFWQ